MDLFLLCEGMERDVRYLNFADQPKSVGQESPFPRCKRFGEIGENSWHRLLGWEGGHNVEAICGGEACSVW